MKSFSIFRKAAVRRYAKTIPEKYRDVEESILKLGKIVGPDFLPNHDFDGDPLKVRQGVYLLLQQPSHKLTLDKIMRRPWDHLADYYGAPLIIYGAGLETEHKEHRLGTELCFRQGDCRVPGTITFMSMRPTLEQSITRARESGFYVLKHSIEPLEDPDGPVFQAYFAAKPFN